MRFHYIASRGLTRLHTQQHGANLPLHGPPCAPRLRPGIGLPLAHALTRLPNLKAKIASAREEFRAVW